MLSREERILGEILVARGLCDAGQLADFAAQSTGSPGATAAGPRCDEPSLADRLESAGILSSDLRASLEQEAAAIVRALDIDLPPNRRISEFLVHSELGRGGMSVVYEAEQIPLGRRVALKLVPNPLNDPLRHERILREARALARLSHPGIVPVYSAGSERGLLFIAMELIEGPTLELWMRTRTVTPLEAVSVVVRAARAVAAAHDQGLVHRDIKPGNILIDRRGEVRVADFGLVHDEHADSITASAAVLGTPAFLAPEAARGEPPDPRTDVYGLGAVLYTLLAGRAPYAEGNAAATVARVLTEEPVPIEKLVPGLPLALRRFVAQAMARDPQARPADAGEFAARLEALEPRLAQLAQKSEAVGEHRRRRLGRWLALAVGIAVIAGAATTLQSLLRSKAPDQRPWPRWTAAAPPHFSLLVRSEGAKIRPALSPDGAALHWIDSSGPGARLLRFDLASGRAESIRSLPDQSGLWLAMATDGLRFVLTSADRTTVFGTRGETLAEHPPLSGLGMLSIAPDGRTALAGKGWMSIGTPIVGSPLLRVDLLTGATRTLGPVSVLDAAFAPDGRCIAYTSDARAQPHIGLLRPDGSDDHPAASFEGVSTVRWDADGSALLALATRGGESFLWRLEVDRLACHEVGPPRQLVGPLLLRTGHLERSADGTVWILTGARSERHLIQVELGRLRDRAATEWSWMTPSVRAGQIAGVALSRGGRFLAIAQGEHGRTVWLYELNSEGTTVRQDPLFRIGDKTTLQIAWHPRSERLLIATNHANGASLSIADARTRGMAPWHETAQPLRGRPLWSPDGRRVVWCEIDGSCRQGWFEPHDTPTRVERLTGLPTGWLPTAWSVDPSTLIGVVGEQIWTFHVEQRIARDTGLRGHDPIPLDADGLLLLSSDRTQLVAGSLADGTSETVLQLGPGLAVGLSPGARPESALVLLESGPDAIWTIDPGLLTRPGGVEFKAVGAAPPP